MARVLTLGWLVAVLMVAGAAPGHGETDDTDPGMTLQEVCGLAGQLNEQAQPHASLDLITEYRTGVGAPSVACSPQRGEALARIALAEYVAALSSDTIDREVLGRAREVCGFAGSGITRENILEACDAGASLPTGPTWSEGLQKKWDTFVSKNAAPLQNPALGMLGFLAVVYVLAMVWTRRISPHSLERAGSTAPGRRLFVWALAVLVMLAAAAAFGYLITHSSAVAWWPALLLLVALTAAAVHLLGLAIGSAFRIDVTAKDADGTEKPESAAHIIGLLNEMGADPPRGAEYPRGTDVTALDAAVFGALPTGNVAKILLGLAKVFLPRAPWEVAVEEESTDRHTVILRRNGRSMSATVVDRDSLGLRHPVRMVDGEALKGADNTVILPDLHRVTAAIVLGQVREPHRITGLGGATEWRSIALQAIATTDLASNPEIATALLARAVNHDPNNLAAKMTLLRFRFRLSTTATELGLYADELTRLIDELKEMGDGERILLQRARLNLSVALINAAFIQGVEDRIQKLADARAIAKEIINDLPAKPAEMKPAEAAIGRNARILQHVGTSAQVVGAETPLEHYHVACHYAVRPSAGPAEVTANRTKALTGLRLAEADAAIAEWRTKDPQLTEFRRTVEYRKALPSPAATELFTLPGYSEFEKPLKRLGITDVEAVLGHKPTELAQLLGTTEWVAGRLRQIALLAARVPAPLSARRLDIAAWIAGEVLSPAPPRLEVLSGAVGESFAETLDETQRAKLRTWIWGVSPPRGAVADFISRVRPPV